LKDHCQKKRKYSLSWKKGDFSITASQNEGEDLGMEGHGTPEKEGLGERGKMVSLVLEKEVQAPLDRGHPKRFGDRTYPGDSRGARAK